MSLSLNYFSINSDLSIYKKRSESLDSRGSREDEQKKGMDFKSPIANTMSKVICALIYLSADALCGTSQFNQ